VSASQCASCPRGTFDNATTTELTCVNVSIESIALWCLYENAKMCRQSCLVIIYIHV
jgi:hypothetical protein